MGEFNFNVLELCILIGSSFAVGWSACRVAQLSRDLHDEPISDDPVNAELARRKPVVCEKWTRELNALLDEHEIRKCDEHTALIGNVEVWVGNWPYSFGWRYFPHLPSVPEICQPPYRIPDMPTRNRLRDAVVKWHDERAMRSKPPPRLALVKRAD